MLSRRMGRRNESHARGWLNGFNGWKCLAPHKAALVEKSESGLENDALREQFDVSRGAGLSRWTWVLLVLAAFTVPAATDGISPPPPQAVPDFDDSSWTTVVLPPADGEKHWPGDFNGVVWYRRSFGVERDILPVWTHVGFSLGEMDGPEQTFVNGKHLVQGGQIGAMRGYVDFSAAVHRGTNVIAVMAIVRDGKGGFLPSDRHPMEIYMADCEFYDGETDSGINYDDEQSVPLSGPWRCFLVPAGDEN